MKKEKVANIIMIGLLMLGLSTTGIGCKKAQKSNLDKAVEAVAKQKTFENYLTLSLRYYEAGQYEKCIEASQESLKLKPDYALAYNNICAANNMLSKYDEGIQACLHALKIDPNFQLAQNNLNWALSGKQSKK
jgi:tetratricopeptide (TPR) repeat protein